MLLAPVTQARLVKTNYVIGPCANLNVDGNHYHEILHMAIRVTNSFIHELKPGRTI